MMPVSVIVVTADLKESGAGVSVRAALMRGEEGG